MRGQAFVAVTALATALVGAVTPAAAQQYPTYQDEHVALGQQCQQSRNNRTVGGAIIGGLAGAILGRELAGREVRSEGAVLGAVVGATAGGAVGRNTAQCDQVPQGSYDPYYGQSQQQYPPQDSYGDDDLSGPPYGDDDPYNKPSSYGDDDYDRDCRVGQVITRDPYGRESRDDVMMCRDDDGVWRPQN